MIKKSSAAGDDMLNHYFQSVCKGGVEESVNRKADPSLYSHC